LRNIHNRSSSVAENNLNMDRYEYQPYETTNRKKLNKISNLNKNNSKINKRHSINEGENNPIKLIQ